MWCYLDHRSPVARVLLNDHDSYYGINGQHGNTYHSQADFIAQEQVQQQREARHNQLNKMSQLHQDYNNVEYRNKAGGLPDLTKMLVETAGDALMDTSNFPPIINRYTNSNFDQYTTEHSRTSARNSVDSGVIYATPHFSPMDTGNLDMGNRDLMGSRELVNDIRLSTSSLESFEPTLNTVSLSPATPPRMKQPHNMHPPNGYHSSPKQINPSLVKSMSQELLSAESPTSNQMNNNNLNWLDLNLASAGRSLTPPDLFRDKSSQNSYPVSNNGSRDADLNLGFNGSTDDLDYFGLDWDCANFK